MKRAAPKLAKRFQRLNQILPLRGDAAFPSKQASLAWVARQNALAPGSADGAGEKRRH
jgi:hypothetical protein